MIVYMMREVHVGSILGWICIWYLGFGDVTNVITLRTHKWLVRVESAILHIVHMDTPDTMYRIFVRDVVE